MMIKSYYWNMVKLVITNLQPKMEVGQLNFQVYGKMTPNSCLEFPPTNPLVKACILNMKNPSELETGACSDEQ